MLCKWHISSVQYQLMNGENCDLIKSFHALRKEIEPNRSMTEKLS
jgi:hypothetical protein